MEVSGDIHVPCDAYLLPFRENFASEDFPPSCWSSYTDPSSKSPDAQWTYTSESYYSHTIGCAKFPDSHSTTIGYLTTPPIYFDANTEYSLVYYQSKTGSYDKKLREGITVWLSKEQNDTTNAIKVGFSRRYDANNIGVVKMDYTFSVPEEVRCFPSVCFVGGEGIEIGDRLLNGVALFRSHFEVLCSCEQRGFVFSDCFDGLQHLPCVANEPFSLRVGHVCIFQHTVHRFVCEDRSVFSHGGAHEFHFPRLPRHESWIVFFHSDLHFS